MWSRNEPDKRKDIVQEEYVFNLPCGVEISLVELTVLRYIKVFNLPCGVEITDGELRALEAPISNPSCGAEILTDKKFVVN